MGDSENGSGNRKDGGMRTFMRVWSGQFVSILGSAMTGFGLSIWAWMMTGQATALALVAFASFAPMILLSPVAGALVDRWDRKKTMILSDLASGMGTAAILALYSVGALQIWHLYIVCAVSGAFGAFQFPAYSAAITTMVDKKHYGRASAMMGLADSAPNIMAPILAAALLPFIGIVGIMAIDVATFVYAIAMVMAADIPNPEPGAASKERGSLLKDSAFGFRYIMENRSMLMLLMFFLTFNFLSSFGNVLLAPMILARSGTSEVAFGAVQSVAGIGGLVGGVAIAVWGGPKYRMGGVFAGVMGASLLGVVALGAGRSLPAWAFGAFMATAFMPLVGASSQAIWQSKVPPEVQGRVFAARRMLAQMCIPVSILLAGPLADRVFEPAMASGGALADVFGGIVGTGPGAGMGLMLFASGVMCAAVCCIAMASPTIRNLEYSVPDHDAAKAAKPVPASG